MRALRQRRKLLAIAERLIRRDPALAETVFQQWESALQVSDGLEGLSA